jgi:hypothetical protein
VGEVLGRLRISFSEEASAHLEKALGWWRLSRFALVGIQILFRASHPRPEVVEFQNE